MELKEVAKTALNYLEIKEIRNTRIWVQKDVVPEWFFNLVHDAHGDFLPDDYKYSFIHDSLCIIAYSESEEDYFEAIDQDVDIYTSALLAWLSSNIDRVQYINDVLEEYPDIRTGDKLLMIAQFKEREDVFNSVLNSLNKQIEIINETGEV